MIKWDSVSVVFGETRVLGPISLEVSPGEWLGVIGPNGSGKSTLLKTPVGVVGFDGRVTYAGSVPRPGLDVAWMPQRPHLPDEMRVSDYVTLGRTPHLGYLAGEGEHDLASVAEALDVLDLGGFATRALATLSGGEAQRVVLARALAQEAPVLLLDEPTANLDVGHGIDVLEVLDELRRSRGLTVVTAVHDLTLAGRYADRLALLSRGRLDTLGRPAEVLTEETLRTHYGADIRVLTDHDGPIVIPTRPTR